MTAALTERGVRLAVETAAFCARHALGNLRGLRVEISTRPLVTADAAVYVEADDEALHSLADVTRLTDATSQTWHAAWDSEHYAVVRSTSERVHVYDVGGHEVRVLVQLTTVTEYEPDGRHADVDIEGRAEFEAWAAEDVDA